MPEGSEIPSRPSPPTPPSRRRSALLAAGVAAGAVGAAQLLALSTGSFSLVEDYLGLVLLQGALLALLVGASRLEGRSTRDYGFSFRGPVGGFLAVASLLALLYVALAIDPGFFLGFGRVPLDPPLLFGLLLFLAPLMAVSQVGLFFGYLLRTLSRLLSFRSALLVSAGLYAAFSMNLVGLPVLGLGGSITLFFTTGVTSFALGLALALYTYKSGWTLPGPIVLATTVLLLTTLLPVAVRYPGWEAQFAASLFGYGVLLVVVGLLLKEPRLQARKYLGVAIEPRRFRFRDRARERSSLPGTLGAAAVVGVVAITFTYGLPTVLETPTPVLAIATGSMVPTFHRGELIVISRIAAPDIHVGTILAFDVGCLPSPTVHRVVKIVSTGPNWAFQTRGDANPGPDPCIVPYGDVLGAVRAYVPYVGFVILDPLFAASLVALVLLVPLVWRGGRA
jgi:signal peptidase I